MRDEEFKEMEESSRNRELLPSFLYGYLGPAVWQKAFASVVLAFKQRFHLKLVC